MIEQDRIVELLRSIRDGYAKAIDQAALLIAGDVVRTGEHSGVTGCDVRCEKRAWLIHNEIARMTAEIGVALNESDKEAAYGDDNADAPAT